MAASWDTARDTGRDSAGSQRPGAGGTRRKLSAGKIEGRATRSPGAGHSLGQSNQTQLRGAPLTCPRTWSSRKPRQKHRFDRLCTLCMIGLFPPALTRRDLAPQIGPAGPAAGPAPASVPRRHRRRFYSAFPGRARAGWLQGRQGEGGVDLLGGEWNEPRGCHGNWPWVQLSLGRGPGACVCLCVATGFSRSAGRGRVESRGRDPGLARARGKETPVSSWKPLCLPPGPRHRHSPPRCALAVPSTRGALLRGCLQFGAICGGLARGPGG